MNYGSIGLKPNFEINDYNVDRLVEIARDKGCAHIPVITPDGQTSQLILRVEKNKNRYRVEVDMFGIDWDISDKGRDFFDQFAKGHSEDMKDPHCGKTLMRVYVRQPQEAGLWLMFMLGILENGEHLEEVRI